MCGVGYSLIFQHSLFIFLINYFKVFIMLVKRAMSKNVVSVSVPGNREKVLDLKEKSQIVFLKISNNICSGQTMAMLQAWWLIMNIAEKEIKDIINKGNSN